MADVHTNGIESVWAVLKRGIYGVYHQVSEKHLQRYVNEFSFRLNQGACANHTLDRIDAMFTGALNKTAHVCGIDAVSTLNRPLHMNYIERH